LRQKYLYSVGHTVALFNCKLHSDHLICGAAYFVAGLPATIDLLDVQNTKICTIVIPEDIGDKKTYTRLISPDEDIRLDYAKSVGN